MVVLDSPRMTASREEGTLTKVERKQEFIRSAKRAERRGTYSVGIWWMKGILHSIPAPLSGRWATGDCPLLSLFSLAYSTDTELGAAAVGAKPYFFLPRFPFSPESISTNLKLLLSPGGPQYAALLGAWGLSLGRETVVSDSSFNSHWNLGGKCCPLEHVFSFPYFASVCCSVHSSVQKHIVVWV